MGVKSEEKREGVKSEKKERERERERDRETESGKIGRSSKAKKDKVKLVAFVLSLKNLINNFYFQSSLNLKFLNEFYHFQKNLIFWESAKVF